jgi:hypothetical protein
MDIVVNQEVYAFPDRKRLAFSHAEYDNIDRITYADVDKELTLWRKMASGNTIVVASISTTDAVIEITRNNLKTE